MHLPQVREAMVAAGVAVVDAHGAGTGAATMMPLFEGFLDAGACLSLILPCLRLSIGSLAT